MSPAKQRRRIAVVTGTRAEFGLLQSALRAMAQRPRLEVRLIVTGMHLLPKFGETINHIRAAGWHVDATVPMQTGRDDPDHQAAALGKGIRGIADALHRLKSDIVVVLGDRIEAFAGACAAATSRRVLAHIHGGDRATGDLDDSMRNAITRLAHVHLAASQDAVDRLRRMGEEARRIHRVGAPGLDDIREIRASAGLARGAGHAAPVRFRAGAGYQVNHSSPATLDPPASPYAVVVQHPLGRTPPAESAVMSAILRAVVANSLHGAILYPSSDPGHTGILDAIKRWGCPAGWRVFRSLPRYEYLKLVGASAVLVGNSSSGIIESASLGVRAVNVGPRQTGRLKCGPTVLDCAETFESLRKAIGKALRQPAPRPGRSVYGDGRAGERIARILERLRITPELLRKKLMY